MWCNKVIFEDNFQRPNNSILTIHNFIRGIINCYTQSLYHNIQPKVTLWWPIKHNNDCTLREMERLRDVSACYETLNEDESKVTLENLELVTSLIHVEIWGTYVSFDMAWMESNSHLVGESNSKILLYMVTNNYKFSGAILILVRHFQNILALDWQLHVQFHHTWKEETNVLID